MSSKAVAGEPQVITPKQIADMRAMSKRSAETGELFAYDPATRKAEVYAPAKRSSQVVEVVDVAVMHLTKTVFVHATPRWQNLTGGRERRARPRRTSRTSRGDPDDGEADHLRVIPHATFRRVLRHALGEQV